MISVHQMDEVLGKVSGCSCTQLEEYSSEAGVSFRKCCIRMSSKTGSQPITVTRIFLLKNVRVNGDWRYLSKIAMVLSS